MLILSRTDVEELLDPTALIEALARAMADLSAGAVSMPTRIAADVPERGFLGVMPAYLPSFSALTTKLVTVFPANAEAGIPTHQAVIVAFDPDTGTPLALMDAISITEARTAAGSALATRLLARPEASVLAVLGTGVQARAHARAIPRVREIREIRVAGRDQAGAVAVASELSVDLGIPVRPAASYAQAMDGADVVCACTHSPEPVVRGEWLPPGVHVNSVGFNTAGREVDGATVAGAVVAVESRASALAPPPAGSNDLTWPMRDGQLPPDFSPAEIGELVSGARRGRTSPDQITLYKSVGVAAEDAAAAALVLARAHEEGAGGSVEV